MEQLDRVRLVKLLQLYEGAIHELKALDDPSVAGLLARLEMHRAEVIAALTAQNAA